MAYTKQTWENLPSQTTPINADRLSHIEDGIYDAASTADTAASNASSALSGLADKVDKVEGKGLSTNDFTDALKTKLDNVEAGAEVNVQSDWDEDDSSSDAFIQNKPTLGTASAKNSTSVVTQSTDLVESGAVYDALGFGNKNLCRLIGVNNTIIASCKAGVTYTFSITNNGHCGLTLKKNDSSGGQVAYRSPLVSGRDSVTFTADSNFELFLNGYGMDGYTFVESTSDFQLEVGSTATSYEPYHASVSDSLAEKADNSVIGTVEDGTNPTKAYAVGEHFVRNGKFCTVTVAVTTSSTWVEGSNYTSGDVASCLITESGTLSDFNSNITRLHQSEEGCYRYGKIAEIICVFRVNSAISGTNTLFKTPFAKQSSGSYCTSIFPIFSANSPFDAVGISCYITRYGDIRINGNLPEGDYIISAIYICQ